MSREVKDRLGCPLSVGDIILCSKTGQGDFHLYERDVLEIGQDGESIKIRGFSKWRKSIDVISTKPHREIYPEYFI